MLVVKHTLLTWFQCQLQTEPSFSPPRSVLRMCAFLFCTKLQSDFLKLQSLIS